MNSISIPKDAVCPNCKSENTVMLESGVTFNQYGDPIDKTYYRCLACSHNWKIVKEVKI